MIRSKLIVLVTVALGAASSALTHPALADGKLLKRSEVPTAVVDLVGAKYPRFQIIRFFREMDAGRPVYEVELRLKNDRRDVLVSPDGTLLVEEQRIALKDAPDAVQRSLAASRFARDKVVKTERVLRLEKREAPTYEIVVEAEGKKQTLVYDVGGQLLSVLDVEADED